MRFRIFLNKSHIFYDLPHFLFGVFLIFNIIPSLTHDTTQSMTHDSQAIQPQVELLSEESTRLIDLYPGARAGGVKEQQVCLCVCLFV